MVELLGMMNLSNDTFGVNLIPTYVQFTSQISGELKRSDYQARRT